MKRFIMVLWTSMLTARFAAAAPMPINLGDIRPVVSPDKPVSKIKFKTEFGPGDKTPNAPEHFTQAQVEEVEKFLASDMKNPGKNMSEDLLYRVIDVLAKTDMYFKRPIPTTEWDRRLEAMKDEFVKRNGRPEDLQYSAQQWENAIDSMLEAFVKEFGDAHTYYLNRKKAKKYRQSSASQLVGFGAKVGKVAEGVELEIVYPGSPAEKAGLVDGDIVTAVDNVSTQGEDLSSVIGRLQGEADTTVLVKVVRLSDPVNIRRAMFQMPDIFGKMAASGIGYVYFSSFNCHGNTDDTCIDRRLFTIVDALKSKGANKLIIDLRGNLGGLLDIAKSIGSEFLRDEDVIALTKRQEKLETKAVTDGLGRYADMPLAIIVNGWSASASEMLAAGLQEHGRATIVGSTTTYGKGSFQSHMMTAIPRLGGLVSRPDGTALHMTKGGWYTPQGRSVEGVHDPETGRNIPGSGGVMPNEMVMMSPDEERAVYLDILRQLSGRPAGNVKDAALEKAIEVLNH
jgi:carboxyl-terminal processing protease